MSKKNTIKTVSFLWLGSLIGAGSTFLIYMILARALGAENFGLFSSAIATVNMCVLLAVFGVSQFWLKIFGKEGWQAVRWLESSFKFVSITIILTASLLLSWGYFGPHSESMQLILSILFLFLVGQVVIDLVGVKLQLEEKYTILVFWQFLPHLTRLIVIGIGSFLAFEAIDVENIAYAYAFVGVLFTLLGLFQLSRMSKGEFTLKGHIKEEKNIQIVPTVKNVFSGVWPFGLAGIFSFIYLQSDIILIKYLVGDEQAGFYNVGFTLIAAILIFPTVFYQKFLMPKVHRWANYDRDKFYDVYKKGNVLMFISGSVMMMIIWLLSDILIPILFGEKYTNSILLLNILSLTLPIYFMAYSVGTTLVTQEHMKIKVKLMGIVAIINILLNILLIPEYNAVGAAIATVVSNLILLILYYSFAQKIVFINEITNGR